MPKSKRYVVGWFKENTHMVEDIMMVPPMSTPEEAEAIVSAWSGVMKPVIYELVEVKSDEC